MEYVYVQFLRYFQSTSVTDKVIWMIVIIGLLLSYPEGQRNRRKYKYWDSLRLKQKIGKHRRK